ncbi:hypothetical protein E2C01_091851 [Portunus trituberculatus]|uniref:Uncharacterized protein n=1 Tax=Portunus trituberculatus TaxID=210409 RepID=A0A5B7JPS9_PORTR|nr:hypothetical protein [Portunus trituberculatus]
MDVREVCSCVISAAVDKNLGQNPVRGGGGGGGGEGLKLNVKAPTRHSVPRQPCHFGPCMGRRKADVAAVLGYVIVSTSHMVSLEQTREERGGLGGREGGREEGGRLAGKRNSRHGSRKEENKTGEDGGM